MSQPTAYTQINDYSDELTTSQVPGTHGAHLDQDFQAVKLTTDQIRANLALLQRDDGKLKNLLVTPDSLSAATKALIASDWIPRGEWATDTVYAVGNLSVQGGATYVCAVPHTSGAFITDLSAVKWMSLTDAAGLAAHLADTDGAHEASAISFTPPGNGGVARDVTSKLAEAESIADRGAAGDGTTSDRSALANAISAASDVRLTGIHLIDSDITIPATNTLHFDSVAKLKIADSVTVTINGTIDAPVAQIFDCVGTGKVVFGAKSQKAVYYEWFGVVGDGSTTGTWGTGTDNETAFGKCLTACQNGGLCVVAQPGAVYRVGPAGAQSNSLWLWPDNMVYRHEGATFLANVFASDWEQRTTHQTENVIVHGGIYYPIGDDTDPASPPVPATDRYIQGNNAFGVLYGKNITWVTPRAKCMKRVAGLTIQTSSAWGASPYFANIDNVRVISPTIEGTANPIGGAYTCPAGILLNSVSIDNAIRHVYVTNPIVRQCYRAVVASTGAVSNYMENINITDLDAENISDVGSIIVGVVHGKFTGTINGVGWQGVRSQGNAFCDIDFTLRGAATMAVPDGQTGTICALITQNATHAVTGPNNIRIKASGYAVGTPFVTGMELSSDGDHFPLLDFKWCTTGIDNNVGGTKRTAVVDTMIVKGVATDVSAATDPKLYIGEIVNMDAAVPVRTRLRPATSTGTANFGMDAANGATFDVASGGTATPFGAADNFSGLLMVQDLTGSAGMAVFAMSVSASTKVAGAAAWGTSAGGSTHNVYYNGSTHVTVQNTTGVTVTYRALAIRMATVGS